MSIWIELFETYGYNNRALWGNISLKDQIFIYFLYFIFCSLCLCILIVLTHIKKLEKAMAPHSSTLAWKIPWTEEPGGLQSMGSLRVGHDWATSLSLFTFLDWRRTWQPTPVFLPREPQGLRGLVGCRPWVTQTRTRLKRLRSSSSSSA